MWSIFDDLFLLGNYHLKKTHRAHLFVLLFVLQVSSGNVCFIFFTSKLGIERLSSHTLSEKNAFALSSGACECVFLLSSPSNSKFERASNLKSWPTPNYHWIARIMCPITSLILTYQRHDRLFSFYDTNRLIQGKLSWKSYVFPSRRVGTKISKYLGTKLEFDDQHLSPRLVSPPHTNKVILWMLITKIKSVECCKMSVN